VTLVGTPQGGVFAGPGVTGSSFNPTTAGVGTHAITYTFPGNPCTLASNINIVVNARPTVDAGPGLSTIQGVPVNLQGSGTQGSSFAWTPAIGLNNPTIASPVATPQQTTHYTLMATLNGCSASDTMTLTVNLPCNVDPAKAFTPNGDGINDLWIIGSLNSGCILGARVNVYNRWGAQVYQSNDYRNNWDGRYKGDLLPDGTYYYIITYTKAGSPYPFTVKGNLTILR
jgi:gliding motility-associated-like protein